MAVSVVFPGAGCASDPPGREGTAELTADLFLGGTRHRTAKELAAAIDDLAAILDVSAGSDSSVARLGVLEPDLDAGLALLAEVLTEATFPEEEFEKSRRRQIDTLKEQRSQPDFLAHERLLDRLYPGHPYGRLTPTERGLAATNRDDVARFAAERLSLGGATLLLAGSAGPDRLISAAEKAFGGLPLAPAGPPPLPSPKRPPFAKSPSTSSTGRLRSRRTSCSPAPRWHGITRAISRPSRPISRSEAERRRVSFTSSAKSAG